MKTVAVLSSGALFGYGLSLATMISPEVVLGFLRWSDGGLLLVLGGAVAVAVLPYQLGPRLLKKPLFGATFNTHPSVLSLRTLGGAAIFGLGWGLSGVCPGPAVAGLGAGNLDLLWSVGGLFAGAWLQGRLLPSG